MPNRNHQWHAQRRTDARKERHAWRTLLHLLIRARLAAGRSPVLGARRSSS